MASFPFTAIVGSDDMALALTLSTISPELGGVLVRGEKGTAKSTMVRALDDVLPPQEVVRGCRFACDPAAPDPQCPDGAHTDVEPAQRRHRLVELPVGATEDRVVGSLDLQEALGHGQARFDPGLLAQANRGILYVDEVNLLHDHLVDLLLDAAAMGRNTVERDGVSVSHAARMVLIGTMNPEEGELRPQLLDRFGLTVEIAAPRDPEVRVEVVRRRLAFDADPAAFCARFAAAQAELCDRLEKARARVGLVRIDDDALLLIAEVCAAFEVDGMRADIVTARAAAAHAAWQRRESVTKADIRAAARLALPHRRRRNPFDAPGLDDDLLDELLGPDDPEDPDDPGDGPHSPDPGDGGPDDHGDESQRDDPGAPTDAAPDQPTVDVDPAGEESETRNPLPTSAAPSGVAVAHDPFRAKLLTAHGVGRGDPGKRSPAMTSSGRTVGARPWRGGGPLHLPATIRSAALAPSVPDESLAIRPHHLRAAITEGKESNLVLFCVDASGSMAARRRMVAVKTAVLSLLMDAYQRRDKVGLIAFRRAGAELLLPPTHSVEAAARRLADLPHGGRTPLAEGLTMAYEVVARERLRDPRRRALVVVITDGRATSGVDPLVRAHRVAGHLRDVDAVVVDCESGRLRLGLAGALARVMGAEHILVDHLGAEQLVAAVQHCADRRAA